MPTEEQQELDDFYRDSRRYIDDANHDSVTMLNYVLAQLVVTNRLLTRIAELLSRQA